MMLDALSLKLMRDRSPTSERKVTARPRKSLSWNRVISPASAAKGASRVAAHSSAGRKAARISAHPAHGRNLVFQTIQAAILSRPDDFTTATVIRIAADLPLAVVDDDRRSAVIETKRHQVIGIAVQRQRFAAHVAVREQQDGAALLILRLLRILWLIILLLTARFAFVHHACRRYPAGQAASQVIVAARPEDAAHTAVIRIAAQLPVAVVDDDAGGAVIEADVDEIVRVAVQPRRAAILSRARIHFQHRATAIAAAIAAVRIAARTAIVVAHFTYRGKGIVHAR